MMMNEGEILELTCLDSCADSFEAGGAVGVKLELLLRKLPGRREVWCGLLEDGDRRVLVKIFHKHNKRDRDVEREWDGARKLEAAGLPVAEPWFLGDTASGERVMGSEYISGGQPLSGALDEADKGSAKEMLVDLVRLHESQHKAGCFQSDDHLGNYLWSGGRLWVLDAGSYVFEEGQLAEGLRVKNMAMLEAALPLKYREVFRKSRQQHYALPLPGIEDAVRDAVIKRRDAYARKTRRACTDFEHVREGGKEMLACRRMDGGLRDRFLAEPDQFFKEEGWLKKGNTSSVVELDHGGRHYVLKRYNAKSWWYRLTHVFSMPRALKSWTSGNVLALFGIPSPRPLACLLVRKAGLISSGYLLMEKSEGITLTRIVRGGRHDLLPDAVREFGDRLDELKVIRATHGDMKASNFILDKEGQLQLIDLDGMQLHSSKETFSKRRTKDKDRFMRNWEKHPEERDVFVSQIEELKIEGEA